MDLVQREVKVLLQSALDIALSVVRANPTVLEGLGAHLEGDTYQLFYLWVYVCAALSIWFTASLVIFTGKECLVKLVTRHPHGKISSSGSVLQRKYGGKIFMFMKVTRL